MSRWPNVPGHVPGLQSHSTLSELMHMCSNSKKALRLVSEHSLNMHFLHISNPQSGHDLGMLTWKLGGTKWAVGRVNVPWIWDHIVDKNDRCRKIRYWKKNPKNYTLHSKRNCLSDTTPRPLDHHASGKSQKGNKFWNHLIAETAVLGIFTWLKA